MKRLLTPLFLNVALRNWLTCKAQWGTTKPEAHPYTNRIPHSTAATANHPQNHRPDSGSPTSAPPAAYNKILANLVIADFENRWGVKERDLQKQFDAGDLDASALTRAERTHRRT